MIEVNLLPGATRRVKRRNVAFKLPQVQGLGKLDAFLIAAVAAWILAPGLVGWMYMSTARQKNELTLDLDQATQDSARYETTIKANQHLRARRDTIAKRLLLIQDIDGDRYTWAHVLDEVSRALPPYTWISTISEVKGDTSKLPRFQIDGRTGNTFALTEFMKDLESSPFIRGVQLITTGIQKEGDKDVHAFTIQAQYELPPADAIHTVPLFRAED